MNSKNNLPLKHNGNDFISPCDQEEIIDRLDCVQRDFAEFKRHMRIMIREEFDRYLQEVRKPRPYIERGYRGQGIGAEANQMQVISEPDKRKIASDEHEHEHEHEPEWSDACLVDNLKQQLALIQISKSKTQTDLLNTPNDKFNTYFSLISNRHYVNQCFHYLKIGILSPVPEFLVSLPDLSPELVKELAFVDKKTREFILKQAVGRIFEDINAKLYHNSIAKVLKVEVID